MMNKSGQSIVEYVLIAILVIVGIIFMGPYVLRSINAHFKLWDEGVKDSFEENIRQCDPSCVPDIPTNCQTVITNGACGSPCNPDQRQWSYNYFPLGCYDGATAGSGCNFDPSYCCKPQPLNCGKTALPAAPGGPCPPDALQPNSPLITSPAPMQIPQPPVCVTPPTPPPGFPQDCYYGERMFAYPCGDPSNPILCVVDSSCPLPQCTGILADNALFCSTHTRTPDVSGLTGDTPITLACDCSSPQPCQAYCDPSTGTVYDANSQSCVPQFPGFEHGHCANTTDPNCSTLLLCGVRSIDDISDPSRNFWVAWSIDDTSRPSTMTNVCKAKYGPNADIFIIKKHDLDLNVLLHYPGCREDVVTGNPLTPHAESFECIRYCSPQPHVPPACIKIPESSTACNTNERNQ